MPLLRCEMTDMRDIVVLGLGSVGAYSFEYILLRTLFIHIHIFLFISRYLILPTVFYLIQYIMMGWTGQVRSG